MRFIKPTSKRRAPGCMASRMSSGRAVIIFISQLIFVLATPLSKTPTEAIFNANMMFVRVACAFAHNLEPATKLAPHLSIEQFDDCIGYMFLHDWITGQAAEEILHVGLEGCTRFFIIHNVYDHARSIPKAEPAALQRKYNDKDNRWGYLTESADAVIYCWAARFEPYQKGFFLLATQARKFLLDHPKAQPGYFRVASVIGGGGGTDADTDILVDRFFIDLLKEPRLHG